MDPRRKKLHAILLVMVVMGVGVLGYHLISGRDGEKQGEAPHTSFCSGLLSVNDLAGMFPEAPYDQGPQDSPARQKKDSLPMSGCHITGGEIAWTTSLHIDVARRPNGFVDRSAYHGPRMFDPWPTRFPDGVPGAVFSNWPQGFEMYLRISECAQNIVVDNPLQNGESWYMIVLAWGVNFTSVDVRRYTDLTVLVRDRWLRTLGCDVAVPNS